MSILYKTKGWVVGLVLWAVLSGWVWGAIPTLERNALIAFYNATNGAGWANNWKTPPLHDDGFALPGTEGTWYGITVEADHVVTIFLNNTNVSGTIPPEIGDLTALRVLRLWNNSLTGSIPPEIGQLGQLEELFLGSTQLSGAIPPEIGNLSHLHVLRLAGSYLSGSIPASLGNLSQLGFFELCANQLSGSIPPELGNLSNLAVIDFQANQLSGNIPPELGNLDQLYYLQLCNNHLSGDLPASLGNLHNLKYGYFINNQLTGPIPTTFGNLDQIIDLWLNNNQLTGNIPTSLGQLTTIKRLYLHHNLLSGEIPSSLINLNVISDLDIGYNCLFARDPNLRVWLNIHDPDWEAHQDQCSGVPPTIIITSPIGGEIWVVGSDHTITWNTVNMTADVNIDYTTDHGATWIPIISFAPNSGSYHWTVPDTVSTQCKIRVGQAATGNPAAISPNPFAIISPSTPSLTLTAPNGGETWIANATHTITWTFTGTLEKIKIEYSLNNGSTGVVIAAAADNTGSYAWAIPALLSSQARIKISDADTGSPSDTSNGPFSIVNTAIPTLERAALIALYEATNGDNWSNNSGWKTPPLHTDGFAVPGTEGRWFGITVAENGVTKMEMYQNNLNGVLPAEIGNLSHLTLIYLDSNFLRGSLPASLGNLHQLAYLLLGQNRLSGAIPDSLGNLSHLLSMQLQTNQFSGGIPASLGNLSSLTALDLSQNPLGGSIPPQLGNLTQLQSLNLYRTQLGGTIPASLGLLLKLQSLDLGINQLVGDIPASFANLAMLSRLYLSKNQLGGPLPASFGNHLHFIELYVDNNNFSGEIPEEWGNLVRLKYLYLQHNHLSGEIPASLTHLVDIEHLDLGYNCLVAEDATLRAWLDIHNPGYEATQNQCGPSMPSITITAPNGGEIWRVGSTQAITWFTTGPIETVRLEYTINNGTSWSVIAPSAPNTGTYSWTVPNTVSSQCKVRLIVVLYSNCMDTSDAAFSIITQPYIHINRHQLHFVALKNGTTTPSQDIQITNRGLEPLFWTLSADVPWLGFNPASGTNTGMVSISVNPVGLAEGTYTAALTVSDDHASNSPQTVDVTLKVLVDAHDALPFGEFSTPQEGAHVSSSVPITGWALDEVAILDVKIYREDGAALVYIGDALLVEGARPDVALAYPDYPFNYKAGWGYMLLTNFLPNGGNGVLTLHAVATDVDGHSVDLGTRTVTVDNANACNPFGAIDTPTQGGTASGKNFVHFGWALTPLPHIIPTNGSTLHVWIDSVDKGSPTYNNYRDDIATLFPGYANSNGAVGYLYIDTTKYQNGIHTLQWTATDSAGNTDGIGSRYFNVYNTGTSDVTFISNESFIFTEENADTAQFLPGVTPVGVKKGYANEAAMIACYPDENSIIHLQIKELEPIHIYFTPQATVNISTLPIGSTFDPSSGLFSWMPGPGFVGQYSFVFVEQEKSGQMFRKEILVHIAPKFQNLNVEVSNDY